LQNDLEILGPQKKAIEEEKKAEEQKQGLIEKDEEIGSLTKQIVILQIKVNTTGSGFRLM
jgi:hypothetical protein